MIDWILVVVLAAVVILSVGAGYFLAKFLMTGVPFVPTSRTVAKKMVELAKISPGIRVYDLGCGNGKILFLASEYGARCVGYELVRPLVWWAKLKNRLRQKQITFLCSDFFKADLCDADVIFCYLFPGAMDRFFREKFPELRPGTKIISHGFPILELEPMKKVEVGRAKIWVYEK